MLNTNNYVPKPLAPILQTSRRNTNWERLTNSLNESPHQGMKTKGCCWGSYLFHVESKDSSEFFEFPEAFSSWTPKEGNLLHHPSSLYNWGCSLVVEWLRSMCKLQSSAPQRWNEAKTVWAGENGEGVRFGHLILLFSSERVVDTEACSSHQPSSWKTVLSGNTWGALKAL